MPFYTASVSFGKDSLYMLLRLIEEGAPLNEVVFYDTGMEFQAIYDTRDAVLPILREHGIAYVELKPDYDFLWKMFDKPVQSKKNGFHYGYSWCGGVCRWGTTDKTKALDRQAEAHGDYIQYVGIAADEAPRIEKKRNDRIVMPLVEWGVTEAACLEGCYDRGFEWLEGGARLYDLLDRVSCWCCKNKNLKELKNIYLQLPEYWQRLKDLQSRTDRPMKGAGKSVFDLEKRFAREEEERKAREAAAAAQLALSFGEEGAAKA